MANFSWKTIIWFILVSSFIYFYYLPQAKKKFTSHQLQSLSQTEWDSELLLVKMMERLVIGNGKISVLWYLSKLLFHCGNLSAISHFIPPLPLNIFWELWPREKCLTHVVLLGLWPLWPNTCEKQKEQGCMWLTASEDSSWLTGSCALSLQNPSLCGGRCSGGVNWIHREQRNSEGYLSDLFLVRLYFPKFQWSPHGALPKQKQVLRGIPNHPIVDTSMDGLYDRVSRCAHCIVQTRRPHVEIPCSTPTQMPMSQVAFFFHLILSVNGHTRDKKHAWTWTTDTSDDKAKR